MKLHKSLPCLLAVIILFFGFLNRAAEAETNATTVAAPPVAALAADAPSVVASDATDPTATDRVKAFELLCLAEQSGDDNAGKSIYSMIKGSAKFKHAGMGLVDVEDYSPTPVELVIRDLDDQERTVNFVKYDPKTKQVQTDYQFGESNLLPLSAFDSESYPVIQNAWKKEVFEDGFRLNINKKVLSRKECEKLGFVRGDKGPSKVKYDGVVFQLNLSIKGDSLVLHDLAVESRCYSKRKEQWAGKNGKTGPPKESQKYDEKSFKVKELLPGSTIELETDPLVVQSYSTLGTFYISNGPTDLESKILGVCVRVECEMEDGATVYRDFSEPSSLKKKTTW